jgi:hypothetical protein
MLEEPKRWQVRIWTGDEVDQPVTICGESIGKLREAVAEWLESNKPTRFGNAHPDYEITRRVNYAYSDGINMPPFREVVNTQTKQLERRPLEEGWYWVRGEVDYWSNPQRLRDFGDVISRFIRDAMIVEKGPDYREVVFVDGKFQLHLIRTVQRESKELLVNDMLQRGWYIIGLEYKGNLDRTDQMSSRDIIFVLGHPEENAS